MGGCGQDSVVVSDEYSNEHMGSTWKKGISSADEWLSASQGRLCSVELFSSLLVYTCFVPPLYLCAETFVVFYLTTELCCVGTSH